MLLCSSRTRQLHVLHVQSYLQFGMAPPATRSVDARHEDLHGATYGRTAAELPASADFVACKFPTGPHQTSLDKFSAAVGSSHGFLFAAITSTRRGLFAERRDRRSQSFDNNGDIDVNGSSGGRGRCSRGDHTDTIDETVSRVSARRTVPRRNRLQLSEVVREQQR